MEKCDETWWFLQVDYPYVAYLKMTGYKAGWNKWLELVGEYA
jgi:hypothetical protein